MLEKLAQVATEAGALDVAAKGFQELLPVARKLHGADARDVAGVHGDIAFLLVFLQKPADALGHYEEARRIMALVVAGVEGAKEAAALREVLADLDAKIADINAAGEQAAATAAAKAKETTGFGSQTTTTGFGAAGPPAKLAVKRKAAVPVATLAVKRKTLPVKRK